MTSSDEVPKNQFQRLPKNAVPVNYVVRIKPDLEKFVFSGNEDITVEIKESSPRLVLNARELQVQKVTWKGATTASDQQPSKWTFNETTEWFEIFFDPPLPSGTGTLSISYTGTLNDKMKGFYRSKFKSAADGKEYYNGVTQFEATDARRAFLCWDEPAIKATFDIILVVPKDKVALSNMPVKEVRSTPEGSSLQVIKFERTPIMSTFIVAWIVGDFDYVETTTSDGVLCRVYTPPGKKEQGRYALRVAAEVLPYYKQYFGIAYPLNKMDLVAVADFSFGAMENWGLLVFRETCLLVDEKTTSAGSRQSVALVVGHEIAHQWFGNLVTPEWWTHLWLKEGYATFIEFLCVDFIFPEYDIWSQFVTDCDIFAKELDCLQNSHPIEVQVGHPSEIDSIFDEISYNKGAAVIRMLHNYIGDELFRKGMEIYLKRHAYANAFTEDLWQALEEASSKPVGAVMKTWTEQMGFPLIRVTEIVHQGRGQAREFILTQERFVLGAGAEVTDSKYEWMVPIKFSSEANADPQQVLQDVLLDKKSMHVVVEGVKPDHWVKLNPGMTGFYRVQYPSQLLARFIPAIKSRSMPPLDRLGILDDVFALAQAGHCPTAELFKLLPSFVNETSYTVWACIANVVDRLDSLAAHSTNETHYEKFVTFGLDLFRQIAGRLGWESGGGDAMLEIELPSHLEALLRRVVLQKMVHFKDPGVIAEALRRFKLHVSGGGAGAPLAADLRAVVYRAVFGSCDSGSGGDRDPDTLATMLQLYRDSDTMEEKQRIGAAMEALRDPGLIRRALEFAISDDVRSQDTAGLVSALASAGGVGRDATWEFFKGNKELLYARYTGQLYVGSQLVKDVCKHFTTAEQAEDVKGHFKQFPLSGTERAVEQALETIALNAAWLKRIEEVLDGADSLMGRIF